MSAAVARYLYKLMAYKDEYEVARLALDPKLDEALTESLGPGAVLYAARGLRGTAFDVFGRDSIRRLERALIPEYRGLIERAVAGLSAGSYEQVVKLARTRDIIRGYEDVKRKNVERFRQAVASLLDPPTTAEEPKKGMLVALGG